MKKILSVIIIAIIQLSILGLFILVDVIDTAITKKRLKKDE